MTYIDGMELVLRPETTADHRAVEELTREAFWNHHVPGCNEHYLMHVMRGADCFIDELDYVAVLNDRIVGNIAYTKGNIALDKGGDLEVLSFGPLSVHPDFQGKGIGGALIRHTVEVATSMGFGAILIYGDPAFYCRYGFTKAEEYRIGTSMDTYADALQGLELIPGYLKDAAGLFHEDAVYDVDDTDAEAFDAGFPPKEFEEGLPSQLRFQETLKMNKPR